MNTTATLQPEPPPKPKRKSISKRLRFEIFKRDEFTCLYCGRKPPEVVLWVDHIIAVADGGTNDPANLATSCEPCNAGKSNVPLGEVPLSHLANVEHEQEKLDQLRAISELSIEREKEFERLFRIVSDEWIKNMGLNPKENIICGNIEEAVRKFVRILPLSEILDAIQITFTKITKTGGNTTDCRRYFSGVCWRKIRGEGSWP